MLMRTPARERPRFGERRRTLDRLREFIASLKSATARRPTYHYVEEEPDDNNMDVALAALIDSIERPAPAAPPRVPSVARVTSSKAAPHIPVYERPPHFAIEPRLISPEPASERIEPTDELSQLRKDLMNAISARLGSPDDHLATIRSLLRSVR